MSAGVPRRARFARRQRLLARADFDLVLRDGARLSSRTLRAHYAQRPQAPARLGLIVAKRTAPRAIDRNRFKRLGREAFRARQLELAGLDLILVAKPEAIALDAAALRHELDALVGRVAKLNAAPRDGTIAR